MKDDACFEIPIALFIFKRFDTLKSIFKRLSEIRPKKLYLIADYGRTDAERLEAEFVRKNIDSLITWNCEVVRDYASKNRGVYGNIALGAKRVFEKEERAIFLEDDNLPSASFFPFCKEMLYRYEGDDRVLWVCGTNYLSRYEPTDESSYVFTRQLMPCGWASWRRKYISCYDFDLVNTTGENKRVVRSSYSIKRLYLQQLYNVEYEKLHKMRTGRYYSWDYHLAWTLRAGGYFGVAPTVNLIKNIGVDRFSEHGGTDLSLVMTNRFCSMDSYELAFPLKHPLAIKVDERYERLVERMLLYPFKDYLGVVVKLIVYRLFKFPLDRSLRSSLFERRSK